MHDYQAQIVRKHDLSSLLDEPGFWLWCRGYGKKNCLEELKSAGDFLLRKQWFAVFE